MQSLSESVIKFVCGVLAGAVAFGSIASAQVTLTPNIALQIPGYNQANWQVPINYDLSRLDLLLSGNLPLPSLSISGVTSFSSSVTAPQFCIGAQCVTALFSNPMTTYGDLIYGGTSGAPTRIGIGSSGQCLTSNGSIPTWAACAANAASTSLGNLISPTSIPITTLNFAGAAGLSAGGTNQNITLAPSGAGLTIASSFADKGGQVFNVKAYGATGNGSTDDTAAVEAALSAACVTGGILYFPAGTYDVSSTLAVCPSNGPSVSIMGAGAGVSTISFGSSAGGITIDYSVPTYRAFISDISITSANASATLLALGVGSSAGAEGFSIERAILNGAGTALSFGANTFVTTISGSAIYGNVQIETPSTSGENIMFYGDTFSHESSTAATLTISPASGTLQAEFFGCSFDGTQVTVANAQAHFYGGHWEDTAASSSPYFLTAGNGTNPTEVTISGGTMNNDGHYAAGSFFHVEGGSQLSVIGGFQPCNNIAFFTVINADSGSMAYLSGMQVPNCGGYPNHPMALTGAGVLEQGQNFPVADGVALTTSLPFYFTNSVSMSSGSGAPSGACQSGSIYLNSAGATGSTLYACVSSAWADVK